MHNNNRTQFYYFRRKTHWILTGNHNWNTLVTHLPDSCCNGANKFFVIHIFMSFIKYDELIECMTLNLHHGREDIQHHNKQSKSFIFFYKFISQVNDNKSSRLKILLQFVTISNVFFRKFKLLFRQRTLRRTHMFTVSNTITDIHKAHIVTTWLHYLFQLFYIGWIISHCTKKKHPILHRQFWRIKTDCMNINIRIFRLPCFNLAFRGE